MSAMTLAEREARKTLKGEWRTPIPVNLVDDVERPDKDPKKRYYRGENRTNIKMVVEVIHKTIGDQVKIIRKLTLEWYSRENEGGGGEPDYAIQGKVNLKFSKIKWDNGCAWVRVGSSARDRDDIKHGRAAKVMQEDQGHSTVPPDSYPPLVPAQKVFADTAQHRAAPPDWDTLVAQVNRELMQQMAEVEREVSRSRGDLAEESHGMISLDREGFQPPSRRLVPATVHLAPPPEDQDTEAPRPAGKVLASEGLHSMFCCGPCGKKPQTMEDDAEETPPEEPLPDARDMDKEGFFNGDELEDIIDRINDVVGIWGVSEATERSFIKPPVEALNKLIHKAMQTFVSNPLLDLISYLMDDSLDFEVKSCAIGRYINDHFVKPMCNALVDGLSESFQAIEWIKDQVQKVIMMMCNLVTDEVVSKSVDQINDCDAIGD